MTKQRRRVSSAKSFHPFAGELIIMKYSPSASDHEQRHHDDGINNQNGHHLSSPAVWDPFGIIFLDSHASLGRPSDSFSGPVGKETVERPSGTVDSDHTTHNACAETPAEPPHDGLTAALGGEALAAGTSTCALGTISNNIADMGNYTIAFGDAIFSAAAHSSDPGGTMAAADTFLSVAGADFLFEFTSDKSGGGGKNAWATSETQYIAIDIHDWNPTGGPVVFDSHKPLGIAPDSHEPYAPHSPHILSNELPIGNVANVFATADAQGLNTIASTLTQALTIENHFSLVSGLSMVAA
jgi:hypothetical protein